MQPKFGRSMAGGVGPLALLLTVSLIGRAGADSLSLPQGTALRAAQCDEAESGLGATRDGGGCARISGYVAAGSEFVAGKKIGGRLSLFEPPLSAILSSVGAPPPSRPDAPRTEGSFLPDASGEQTR